MYVIITLKYIQFHTINEGGSFAIYIYRGGGPINNPPYKQRKSKMGNFEGGPL